MVHFLGCLFILIFGGIIFIFALGRMFWQLLFGGGTSQHSTSRAYGGTSQQQQSTYSSTSTGNAHHESSRPNSRQRRSGKIFEKNEGKYVDFEEI